MSQWYLSKNGKALGPLSSDKIISLIQEGEVNQLDLIYQAGNAEWQPLGQIDEFSNAFSRTEDPAPSEKKSMAEWVLLKKIKGENGSEYKQLGPYSKEQVLNLVDEGVIKFTDFAWKQGLETWVRIAEIEEFSQPLPSSPAIDLSLYEKTVPDINMVTLTDVNKASMTEMVKIERFDHQHTQMVSSHPSETEESGDLDSLDASEIESEMDDSEEVSSGFLSDFEDNETGTNFNVDLWSLEPPREKEKVEKPNKTDKPARLAKSSATETIESPVAKKKEAISKEKKNKQSKEKEITKIKKDFKPISAEVWQWGAAAVAFVFSVVFMILSLKSIEQPVAYEEPTDPQVIAQIEEQNRADNQQMQTQELLKETVVTPPTPKVDPQHVAREMEALRKKLEQAKRAASVAAQLNQSNKKKSERAVSKKHAKENKGQTKVKAKKTKVIAKKKKVSSKVVNKAEKPKAKKIISQKRIPAKKENVGSLAVGTSKMQSYYKQRDRKALFYSSLKAEALAIEVQSQYNKIGKDRKKWDSFYRNWKKKLRSSLAKEIRNYPEKKEIYAYPDHLSKFKLDFNELNNYGKVFDSKVRGQRVPSNSPSELSKVFANHKKLAQRLGR